MPDKLTDEERAAIAAFPHERVFRCARGESGIPLHGFTLRDSMRIAAGAARRNMTFRRNREIDDVIRTLHNKGLTDIEISAKVKLKHKTVYQRRLRMGLGIKDKL